MTRMGRFLICAIRVHSWLKVSLLHRRVMRPNGKYHAKDAETARKGKIFRRRSHYFPCVPSVRPYGISYFQRSRSNNKLPLALASGQRCRQDLGFSPILAKAEEREITISVA